jgi:hypothetical protein
MKRVQIEEIGLPSFSLNEAVQFVVKLKQAHNRLATTGVLRLISTVNKYSKKNHPLI